MDRRSMLASAAALAGAAVAGCTGSSSTDGGSNGSDPGTEGGTRTETAAETGTPATAGSPPEDCPGSDAPDLGVDRPDTFTEESAERFVKQFERAYIRDQKIPEGATDVAVTVAEVSASKLGDGYAVDANISYGYQTNPSGETETPVNVDKMGRPVVYYVDDTVLRRKDWDTDRNPREGILLKCWE